MTAEAVLSRREEGPAEMPFAQDKLYKGYLRRNMPTIVSTVRVTEIIPHLPCLTDHDRENIEAKRETYGNYDSMVLLLDCLKRRENWPEEFITALEACSHTTIAAEIRREYDALNGNTNPGSPSATVTRAHVHPVPPASHLSIPERGGNREAAVPHTAETSAPPARPPPPRQVPQQPQPPGTSEVQDCPPPGPVSQPQKPVEVEEGPLPSTPPPSPEIQRTGRSPAPHVDVVSDQEPVENSEPNNTAATPGRMSTEDAPRPSSRVEQPKPGGPHRAEGLQTTTAPAEVRPPPSPPATEVNPGMTYGSRFSVVTPEKPPVQDTTPPIVQEDIPGPTRTQEVDSSLQPDVAAPLPGAAETVDSQSETLLSQPGELISIQPQPRGGVPLPDPSMQPYSGNTARLEMSSVNTSPTCVSACSSVAATMGNAPSRLPCQENGIVVNHNEPEENHYESPNESLDMQEIREDTLQISEEASILDLDGHDPTPQGQIFSGEGANKTISATETVISPPASENYQPPEPAAPPLQDSEKTSSQVLTSNTKYFVTAAGVGVCALLLAWKFKN